MRTPRIILDDEACAYHCLTRVVGREHLFTDRHKDRIQDIILDTSKLLGVHLINWVVMSNHIHILAQIPEKQSREPLTKKTLLQSVERLYSRDYVTDLKQQFERAEAGENPKATKLLTQMILDRYESRRGNISEFMKEVKQRITQYINQQYKRTGTLWEGRFKSPIVERTLEAILAVSTYLDLNPVRAGIVDRPENYRWSGYSAALAGNKIARIGIASIYDMTSGRPKRSTWSSIKSQYRQYLFEKGVEVLADDDSGFKGRRGISAVEVEREVARRGELPLHEAICHRVRYFSDGVVIGSASFVDRVFQTHRARLVAPDSKRNTGARKMRGAQWGNLTSLRDLRVHVIGLPS